MVKKNLIMSIVLILTLIFTINTAFAIQSFNVTPSSFSQTLNLNTAGSGIITINNTGNSSINLSLTKVNLVNGSNSIVLTLNETIISNLSNTSSKLIKFTYNSGSISGTFNGSILISNTQNTSQNISIPINLIVNPAPVVLTGQNLRIIGESSTILVSTDIGLNKRYDLDFDNNGLVNLTNVQFSINNLIAKNSNDRIRNSDVSFNYEGFNLNTGNRKLVEMRINVPSSISADVYEGILTATTNSGYKFNWTLKVTILGSGLDVIIRQNERSVSSGVLKITGDGGTSIRGYNFVVDNIGNVNANNLIFELDSDLIEESTSNRILKSAVTFVPNSLSLNKNRNDKVEVKINIPSNQILGNYFANILVKSQTGVEYDRIKLKLEITGDIYIKDTVFNDKVIPGNTLDLKVTLKNKGSKLYRNVRIIAELNNVDIANSNIFESSSTFLLDINQEKTQTLKFKIPQDAPDGSHSLVIRVQFDNFEFSEIKDINFERPRYNLAIKSFSTNPTLVSCNKNFFTFLKVQNLGKYSEDIKISSEILGTSIKEETQIFNLALDNIIQKNLKLDVNNLKSGKYNLVQKVIYGGSLFKKETTQVEIVECNKFGIGADLNLTLPQIVNDTQVKNDKVKIFGASLEKSTIYLGSGLGAVTFLIILSLFLL